jgi:hypothetical protein
MLGMVRTIGWEFQDARIAVDGRNEGGVVKVRMEGNCI